MLTPIAHDLVAAYAITLDELLRVGPTGHGPLHRLLCREHLDAHDELYDHLRTSVPHERLELGQLVIAADHEGSIHILARGASARVRSASPLPN